MRIFGLDGKELEFSDPLGLNSEQVGLGRDIEQPAKAAEPQTAVEPAPQQDSNSFIPEGVSKQDWDDAVNTLIAEGGGEGDDGMLGVANVIKTRAERRNLSIGDVVRQPSQFEGYENPREGSRKAQQDPQMRQRAERILGSVLAGQAEDNTGGADHFHANYVNPSWNRSMPQTTRIGNHLFYNSKPQQQQGAASAYAAPEPGAKAEPFDAVLRQEKSDTGNAPNPNAKGLARLVSEPEAPKVGSGGALKFVHKGQDQIDAGFAAILRDSSAAMGRDYVIQSGYRSTSHPVEAQKASGGGEHTRRTASDISLKGMSKAERQAVVLDLMARGVKRFGTYASFPDMLHVDMKDMGHGKPHFMFNTTQKMIHKAPDWFKEISSGKLQPTLAQKTQSNAIVVSGDFKPENALGLLGDGENPFANEIAAANQQKAAAAEQQRLAEEQQRIAAENTAVAKQVEEANKESPNRYIAVDEADLPRQQEEWNKANKSTGFWGDISRMLESGNAQVGLAAREVVRMIPGVGESVVSGLDAIDQWVTGSNPRQRLSETRERANASVTDPQLAADQKNWWNAEEGKLGEAWKDPRSYVRGIVESLPAMGYTMGASGMLARGTYMRAIAGGASQRTAAAAAAKTATIAGGIGEGLLAGGDASISIAERIAKISPEQLAQTDAVKALMHEGMSQDDAIKAITHDAQTQALLVSGVITGVFGGFGDRALAKIIAEGVGGNIGKRVAGGAARGIVGEGLLEELPQNVGQTVSENLAIQKHIDPSQDLTEGMGEAVASSIAVGGTMGAGMGAAGGALRPSGPLKRAEHAANERRQQQEQAATESAVAEGQPRKPRLDASNDQLTEVKVADYPVSDDTKPKVGATVRIDVDGIEPFMGTIDSYEGNEAIILDHNTGEVLQVPVENLTPIAPPMGEYRGPNAEASAGQQPPAIDAVPEHSSDPALEPAAPIVQPITTEAPPKSEDMPMDQRVRRPQAGQRITVSDPNAGRFHAKIIRYEDNGREAVVADDDGNEYQVPSHSLRVSKLTQNEIEAQELMRNPPIEREIGDAGENSRKIGSHTVAFPDADHAALYDLGREQALAKRLFNTSFVDMGKVMPVERRRLSEAFGVDPEQLASMADNYRYHAEKAARSAKSKLPTNLFALDRRELKKRQAEFEQTKSQPVTEAVERSQPDTWWNVDTTAPERKKILNSLGIKRSEKTLWDGFPPKVQQRISEYRDTLEKVSDFNSRLNDGSVVKEFMTAKGSKYDLHSDGTTTRDKASRSDPGHEGDAGKKPRSAKTIFLDTNSSVLSAAGLSLAAPEKGARVLLNGDGTATLVTWNKAENGWGASPEGRNVPFHDEPAVGRYPLELWTRTDDVGGREAYSKMHAGNKITEIADRKVEDTPENKADATHENRLQADVAGPDAVATQPAGKQSGGRDLSRETKQPAIAEDIEKAVAKGRERNSNEEQERHSSKTDAAPVTALDKAANEAATSPENDKPEPTQAQKEAGNYKLGHASIGGLDISIENPAGSERKGVSRSGKPWSIKMKSHYGYIRGTVGKDKDHIDVFVKPGTETLDDSSPVFVVDQRDTARGQFDEHKVMVGYSSMEEAKAAYSENYTADWKGMGDVTEVSLAGFKDWLANADTTQPFAPKWFGSREKAEAHIAKKKLADTHSIVENGKRFEIRRNEPQATTPERKALPNATAPEHVQIGVDDRELAQIVDEFNEAQKAVIEDNEPVTYIFHPPAKDEIVRLQDKANEFLKENDGEWLTKEQAQANIDRWKQRARAQGQDPKIRGKNSDKVVLSLFDLTGKWSEPWVEAGYDVHRFDIQDDPIVGDVNNFSVEFFNEWFDSFEGRDIYAILAACPCTDFASSGARHFAAKDKDGRTIASVELVHQTLRTIEYFKPQIWAVENPVGRIEKLGGLPPWRLSFDPNHIGEDYTKKTLIWGRFNADLEIAPVFPSEGSKMHTKYGGKSQATKNARSATPEGFAYSFFMANNAHDNPVMDIANKYDRLDRSLIEQAVKVGIEHREISTAVDDFYYMEMDDNAANDAIRELIAEGSEQAPAKTDERDGLRTGPIANDGKDLTIYLKGNESLPVAGARKTRAAISNGEISFQTYQGNTKSGRWIDDYRAAGFKFSLDPVEGFEPVNLIGHKFNERTGTHIFDSFEYPNQPTRSEPQEQEQVAEAEKPSVKWLNDDFGNWSVPEGTILRTKYGTDLPPAPKFSVETSRDRKASLKRQYQWLIDAAVAESAERAKKSPIERWAAIRMSELNADNMPRASYDDLNNYLFGDTDGPNDTHVVRGPEPKTTKNKRTAAKKSPSGDKLSTDAKNVAPKAQQTAPAVSENKVFTEDAAAKARALLKKKLSGNTLNSGIDPEIMQAGITLAGYHIEKGARTFAAYAKAMLADLGGDVRPFLKSWYMGVKYDPRAAGFDGMSSAADVEAADVNEFTVDADEPAELENDGREALEGVPADTVPRVEEGGNAGSGTGRSSAADVSGSEPARGKRVSTGRSVSDGQGDIFASTGRETDSGTNGQPDEQRTNGGRTERSKDRGDSVKAKSSETRSIDTVPDVATAVTPAQKLPVNYVINDDMTLAAGGQKTKFKANIAAIEVLRRIDAENRPANREEQDVLAQWVGWGGLAPAFYRQDGSVNKGWEKEAAELKGLLTAEEYRAAEASTRNAHYTSKEIVQAAWSIVDRLGFKGGRVLEPSVGSGNFLGMMPGELRDSVSITGVELDHITGNIAKNLYPKANIQAPLGFEALTVPDNYFDVAIGNPPFGSERLYDANRRHLNKLSIHNFFFAKSIEALAPNGLLVMVVTNRFLDGRADSARSMIAKHADLVGAIRLPNNAFLKNAGTEVTTDIIILQKRPEGQEARDTSWVDIVEYTDKNGKTVPLNRYFANNPDMMLGEFGAYGSMYGPDEPALVAKAGQDTNKLLNRAVKALPKNIYKRTSQPVLEEAVTVADGVETAEVGSMFLSPNGDIHERQEDHIGQRVSKPVEFKNDSAKERVAGMLRVRDAFAKLRRAQIDKSSTDEHIENLRARLNEFYDAFVKKHGFINSAVNKQLFRDDPTWPQISALEENYDKGVSAAVEKSTGEKKREPSAKKAAVFFKRTQHPYTRVEKVSTAKDALAVSMNDHGRVNLAAMEALYDKPQEEIINELGDLLFLTPQGNYETKEMYLSGNVRQKLAEAERAQEAQGGFERNIRALQNVIPADIEAVDIDVKAGSPWVPPKYVEDFVSHLLSPLRRPKASYLPELAKWRIEVDRPSPAMQLQWGTDKKGPVEILNVIFNMGDITVRNKHPDGSFTVDQPATDAANEKADRIRAEWANWIWQDDDRREALARIYNDTYNATVIPQYDGSHLTLPGKVGDDVIELRPSQKNFIWRTLQTGTALADHTVGAGKTFAAITSIMEKRRLGQARKPMLVVPNHLVGQWAADFIKLYPGAKILAATKRDFEAANRKRLFARIATGDWDAVIVAHSSFGKIGIAPEYHAKFIQEEIAQLEESMAALRREEGANSKNVKELASWRKRLEEKLKKLMDSGEKDEGLTFDELGVDAIYVDEAHLFKNLALPTSMTRVAGLGKIDGNKMTADLYVKSRFILEQTNGNNIVFLTGTPVSNTMAEMFTMMRYLAPDRLRELGVSHFDAWAKVFGEIVTDWELSPAGKYKLNKRFAKFVNVPELMNVYRSFADVITNADIKAQLAAQGKKFPLPKVKGGKPQNIVVERSPEQADFIGVEMIDNDGNPYYHTNTLIYRSENLPKGKMEKGGDNMLKISGEARKAALDMRLIDPNAPDHPTSKTHRAADEMVRIYKAWEHEKGTQLVFCDLSTPKKQAEKEAKRIRELIEKTEKGDEDAAKTLDEMSPDEFLALESKFSVYDDLKQKLIDRGVPENEIVFIHDANTDQQKEALFSKVRSGQVRFLFGSTSKMGAGTNVQNRLVGLHHLDAPWRPSDLEQRDGRGIRQGNELYAKDPEGFEIEILRYATKNTLDARQWEILEKKATFIEQLRRGAVNSREIEDVEGEAANSAEMKAAASGNPLILEEMDTRRRLKQLQGQATEHDREQFRIRSRINQNRGYIKEIDSELPQFELDAEIAGAAPEEFSAVVNGETFDKPKDFGAALINAMKQSVIDGVSRADVGSYAGFDISLKADRRIGSNTFQILVHKNTENTIVVEDALNADATGTARRVMNTVKVIAKRPEESRNTKKELLGQIEALEKQIGEWKGREELAATEEKHRRLIEVLKPKQKPPAGAENPIVTEDAPSKTLEHDEPEHQAIRDKPEQGTANNMRNLPVPTMPKGTDPHHWALGVIKGHMHTGNEHLIAIEADGSVVVFGTAGRPNDTGMNDEFSAAMNNPQRRMALFHNHPNNSPLSAADFSALFHEGVHSIWAIGHNGQLTRATATPDLEDVLANAPSRHALRRTFTSAIRTILNQMTPKLLQLVKDGTISEADGDKLYSFVASYVANQSGLFDVWVKNDFDYSKVPSIKADLDQWATIIREGFYDNQPKSGSKPTRRPAIAFRHIADVAGMAENRVVPAVDRSAPSGLNETSPLDGREKVARKTQQQEQQRGLDKKAGAAVERTLEEVRGKLTDIQPLVLKTIPLNYFTELAPSNMTAVGDYMRVKRQMDAYRGEKHAEADKIAQSWLKFTRLGFMGKDKAKAQELADLMHDSTLAGIDPSSTSEEEQLKVGYDALRKRFMAMSPAARKLYEDVRDAYADQSVELDDILLDNVRKAFEIARRQAEDRYRKTLEKIKEAGLTGLDLKKAEEDAASKYKAETTKSGWAAKARMTKLRIMFESSRVPAPYFPLGRFGRYFISVRDVDGTILSFSKYEDAASRDRDAKELSKQYPNAKVEKGVMDNRNDLRGAMDPRMLAEIEEVLGGSNLPAELMDEIWQRYLETMPDLSARKRFIHRKGTAGYSQDAMRVFSSHMFHAAHQMARLKYGMELQENANLALDQAKEAADPTAGVTLANELASRHDWVMNPTGGKAAQTVTTAAFVWYLAASPAAAMVNMTQTVMLGLPILGSRFGGIVKAGKALAAASVDSVAGKGSVLNGKLTDLEKRAVEAFYKSGMIDRTQSHDLAGVGETGVEYSPLRAKIMEKISWAFHKAEVWNREVTALAAYRLAVANGSDHSSAIDIAHDLTWKTHFDYSNSSRPALMQNDFAKVALVFRQHNINMLYRVMRDIHQSVKGETPQMRKEARYQLAGIMGMMVSMAGVTGTMGFSIVMALLGMAFDDEDDPIDFQEKFKASVIDVLGPQLGGMVLNGVPGHVLGIDLSARIGMPDLWFRSPNRDLQGKDEYQYWLAQTLGASASLGEQLFTGFRTLTDEGDVARGIEMMAPKAIRDLMKAYRYSQEGLTAKNNDQILSPDDISAINVLAQAIGFNPAKISQTWERSGALKNAEKHVTERRQRLINTWAQAVQAKDNDAVSEALAEIRRFNAVDIHAHVPITRKTLERSLKTRASNAAKREDGALIRNVGLAKELRDRISEKIY